MESIAASVLKIVYLARSKRFRNNIFKVEIVFNQLVVLRTTVTFKFRSRFRNIAYQL